MIVLQTLWKMKELIATFGLLGFLCGGYTLIPTLVFAGLIGGIITIFSSLQMLSDKVLGCTEPCYPDIPKGLPHSHL